MDMSVQFTLYIYTHTPYSYAMTLPYQGVHDLYHP